MNVLEIMKSPAAYASGFENIPVNEQRRAKKLCWEYNQTSPDEQEKRREILWELLGTCHPMTAIEPSFTVIMDSTSTPTDWRSSTITA